MGRLTLHAPLLVLIHLLIQEEEIYRCDNLGDMDFKDLQLFLYLLAVVVITVRYMFYFIEIHTSTDEMDMQWSMFHWQSGRVPCMSLLKVQTEQDHVLTMLQYSLPEKTIIEGSKFFSLKMTAGRVYA